MTKGFHLQVSQEELLYLLRSLGLPDLPGMGEKPWGHISHDQSLLVMEPAGRGLVARGVVKVEGDQVVVDEQVVQVLTVSAYPQQMVVLTYNQGGPTENRNFYRGKEYDVEHSLPFPWIHEFKTIPVSDMGLGIVRRLVMKSRMSQATQAYLIQQTTLDEIRQVSADDVDGATKQLAENGMPVADAQRFARVLATPTLKLLVQAIYQLSGDVRQSMFTILSNAESSWLVSAGQPGDQRVQVMGLDTPQCEKVLSAAFQPFS